VERSITNFPTTTDGSVENATLLQWAVALADWGLVTSVGVWTDPTAGSLLYWGDLTTAQQVNTNNRFEIPIGSLTIAED
jgi:hypothetical protein